MLLVLLILANNRTKSCQIVIVLKIVITPSPPPLGKYVISVSVVISVFVISVSVGPISVSVGPRVEQTFSHTPALLHPKKIKNKRKVVQVVLENILIKC